VKSCFFCGTIGPLTQEHVFPQWIRRTGNRPLKAIVRTSSRPEAHLGDTYSWRVKILCAKCNNEYGGSLEEALKPTLKPMINGETVFLDTLKQGQLAQWAFKTALIAAKAVSRDEPTEDLDGLALFYRTNGLPPAQLCRINTNGLAPQARSVDSFKARQSSGMSGGMTDLEQWGRVGLHSDAAGNLLSQSIQFGLGSALFVVSISFVSGGDFTSASGLLQIYPALKATLVWPTRRLVVPTMD